MLNGQRADVVMTSVLGHVMGVDFTQEYANWNTVEIESLFGARIVEKVSEVSRYVLHYQLCIT